jgi:hypothetical protein
MGFSYALHPISGRRLLCCDFCGGFRGWDGVKWVRKMACPFGWCQHYATCDKCAVAGKHKAAETHKGCKENAAHHAARQAREAEILQSGKLVLRACLASDDDRVKALFRGAGNAERAYVMSAEIYENGRAKFEHPTPEDFATLGNVQEAANTDLKNLEPAK